VDRENSVNALFTIVSNNYLHFAKSLVENIKLLMPEVDVFVAIVDDSAAFAQDFIPEATILGIEDLALPEHSRFIFRYSVLELNTAVKPWVFAKIMALGYQNIVYADPDIYFFAPLEKVFGLLEENHVVLTPHLLEPIQDQKAPSELDIRRVGTYNLGFIALKNSDVAQALILWWKTKLEFNCVVDLESGVFVDQSWMDLVPGLFAGVVVLRDPGHNVAYWNVFQRSVQFVQSQWVVGAGLPLIFFHFSGFNPFSFENFSKHQNRLVLNDLPVVRPLLQKYSQVLIRNGAKKWSEQQYGFQCFADGVRIPELFRVLYRTDKGLQTQLGADPFVSSEVLYAFVHQFMRDGLSITYAMWSLWEVRADLRVAFPLNSFQSIAAFYNWFAAKADIYFEAVVIAKHIEIAAEFQSRVQMPSKYQQLGSRESQVAMFYETILGRDADPQGLASYTRMMGTFLGLWKTIASLFLSRESQDLPNKLQRLSRVFNVLFRPQKPVEQIVWTPKVVTEVGAKTNPKNADMGIYLDGNTEIKNGFWVKKVVLIPVSDEFSGQLFVSGFYVADFMRNKKVAFFIKVLIGDQVIHECQLVGSQHFEFNVDWKAEFRGIKYLRFEASQSWVPKDIHLGNDERELSWRLKKVRIGQVQLFDSQREPALLPLETYLPPQGINLVGYLAAELGVGEAARSLAKSCAHANIPYSIVDVGYQSQNLQRDKSAWEKATTRVFDLDFLYVNADQMVHTLAFLEQKGFRSNKKVAFWHWEQPVLPMKYQLAFEGLLEVWVPSNFVLEAVSQISPVPVFKVPHAMDVRVSELASRAHFQLPEKLFLVLVMYDFLSVAFRKNPDAAVSAFIRCANQHPNMGLVIKTINSDKYPEAYKNLRKRLKGFQVFWIDTYLTRQEVFDLESCCDTMLSLHRAEGFGLGLAEMMALGKPVIATAWSGNMEFMTGMNSCLVDYELKPLEQNLEPYERGQLWAEANIEHAAFHLERLFLDSFLYRRLGTQAKTDMATLFSPPVIGEKIRKRLALLQVNSASW
jgi:glycosyltransferase involved in cell wall biosynthesis